jgi:hypothetical protein
MGHDLQCYLGLIQFIPIEINSSIIEFTEYIIYIQTN